MMLHPFNNLLRLEPYYSPFIGGEAEANLTHFTVYQRQSPKGKKELVGGKAQGLEA